MKPETAYYAISYRDLTYDSRTTFVVAEADLFDYAYRSYQTAPAPLVRSEGARVQREAREARVQQALRDRDGLLLAELCLMRPRKIRVLPTLPPPTEGYQSKTTPVRTDSRVAPAKTPTLPEEERPRCEICPQYNAWRLDSDMSLASARTYYVYPTQAAYRAHLRTGFHQRCAWLLGPAREHIRVSEEAWKWFEKRGLQFEYLEAPMYYGRDRFARAADVVETLRDYLTTYSKTPLPADEAQWRFPKREVTNVWLRAKDLLQRPR